MIIFASWRKHTSADRDDYFYKETDKIIFVSQKNY